MNKRYLPAAITLAILVLSLVSIVAVSIYAYPTVDDFTYGLFVRRAVEQGGNIADVIKAACATAAEYYRIWQGTFSASFIFALQPGGFSYDLYFLTTVLMVGALIASTVFMIYTIVVRWAKGAGTDAILLSCAMLFFQIQFVPDKTQSFFWFNGSAYYTLFYAFSLVFYALLIRLFLTEKHKLSITVALCVSAVLISGGNYSTGLLTWLIVSLVFAWAVYTKQNRVEMLTVFLLYSAGFIISMIAPGNRARAANNTGMNPLQAIGYALMAGLFYFKNWTVFPGILFLLAVGPLTYSLAKRPPFSFKYPLVMVALLFGLFCAQITPPYYAMGSPGAGRQIDIYYYSYFLMVWGIMFYCFGWLVHNRELSDGVKRIDKKRITVGYYTVICMALVMGCALHIREATTLQTASSLLSGEAQQYGREMDEAFQVLDSESEICYLADIENRPSFFTRFGLSPDENNWVNTSMAEYFHHEKIVLINKDGDTIR